MSEIVEKLPGRMRLIPPTDRDKVEHHYNIGIHDLDQDACEVDTDVRGTCLYIKYCSGDYSDIKKDGGISGIYDFINKLMGSDFIDMNIDKIEDLIQRYMLDVILQYDETFEAHLTECPAGNPHSISNKEEPAELWCKYLLERGP